MLPPDSSGAPALTPVQAQVVQALAQGISITAAAAAAGLHRTTIYTWFNSQPHFAAAVHVARADYVASLRDELRDLSRVALAAVRQLLEDPKTAPGIRAKLALAVLQRPQYHSDRAWNLPVADAELAPVLQNSTKSGGNRRPFSQPTPPAPAAAPRDSTKFDKSAAPPPSGSASTAPGCAAPA